MNKSINRNRHTIRLQKHDYSLPGEYFVTICTYNRAPIFGEITEGNMCLSEYGNILQKHWLNIPGYYPNIELDKYVIMPNHIHGIIIINPVMEIQVGTIQVGTIHELSQQKGPNNMELSLQKNQNKIGLPPKMTQYERRIMTLPKIIGKFKMQSAKEINLTRGTTGTPVWQKNYYEHIIRNDKDLQNIRNYIENNPMKWYEDEENKY